MARWCAPGASCTARPRSSITTGCGLFAGLPQPCEVGRYHSLIAAPETLPPELTVSASTAEGEIMGVRHRDLAVEGVQFHPESILTPQGPRLLGEFPDRRRQPTGCALPRRVTSSIVCSSGAT